MRNMIVLGTPYTGPIWHLVSLTSFKTDLEHEHEHEHGMVMVTVMVRRQVRAPCTARKLTTDVA